MANKIEDGIEKLIFASRWVQAPLYLGLIAGCLAYSYKFFEELVHLLQNVQAFSEETVMLTVISLVDITMVANLIIVVIIGGYATFVSRLDLDDNEDRPEWLKVMDAGTLKVKLTTSLVGVSGIHLLKAFVNIENVSHDNVMWQLVIHATFLLSTLILAISEKIMHGQHAHNAAEATAHH
jgi:uncharacterized protein (TIGR00645 family)